jgi:MoxR-like ATPase
MANFQTQEITEESGEPTGDNATYDLGAGMTIDLEVPELEDVGHPLVPDQNQDYMMREINGTQDLKLLSYVIDDPDFFAMLEGEAGVGKNMAVKTIASAANWPMVRVNFGVGTTYQNLVGRYAPVDKGDTEEEALERSEAVRKTAQRMFEENESMTMDKAVELASRSLPQGSNFEWQDGLLTLAVKNGWMFIADEINAADEEAVMPLNGLTEDRDSRYLTIEEKSEVITPHPRFRMIATRNPLTYAGVSEMNAALESRSYVIEFDYHENKAIEDIIKKRTDIVENESEEALQSLVSLAQDIRRQEQSGNEIMSKVSTRDLLKVGRLTDIMDIRNATKTVLMGIADPTDKDSIRELVETQRFS